MAQMPSTTTAANVDREALQEFITTSKRRLQVILSKLNWTVEGVMQSFNTNSSASLPTETVTTDEEPELPPSCANNNFITIAPTELQQIVGDNNIEVPRRFSDLQLNFTREQKLSIYEYVVQNTEKQIEPETVSLKEGDLTFADIVAQKKREKKKRRRYRCSKPTQVEEVRGLVELQMQALQQYVEQSAEESKLQRIEAKHLGTNTKDKHGRSDTESETKWSRNKSHGDNHSKDVHHKRENNWRSRNRMRSKSQERNYTDGREINLGRSRSWSKSRMVMERHECKRDSRCSRNRIRSKSRGRKNAEYQSYRKRSRSRRRSKSDGQNFTDGCYINLCSNKSRSKAHDQTKGHEYKTDTDWSRNRSRSRSRGHTIREYNKNRSRNESHQRTIEGGYEYKSESNNRIRKRSRSHERNHKGSEIERRSINRKLSKSKHRRKSRILSSSENESSKKYVESNSLCKSKKCRSRSRSHKHKKHKKRRNRSSSRSDKRHK